MNGDLFLAAVPTVVVLLVLWRGLRPVTAAQLSQWQGRFAVTVAPEDEGLVRSRLHRARAMRSSFAAVGVVLAALPSYLNFVDRTSAGDYTGPVFGSAWIVGGVLGSVLAEVLVLQRPARRIASLTRRRAGDYVDLRWARWVGGAVVLAALATAAAARAGDDQWWQAPVGLAGALLSAGSLALGLRAIVDRPALAAEGHLREVDEALRSDGAHHLVGACVALSGTAVSVAASGILLRGWAALLGVAAGLLGTWSLLLWFTIARQARWSVGHVRAATAAGTR